MKPFGFTLVVLGLLCGLLALGMDTSIPSSSDFGRVNNIGLMDDRRNYLNMSALSILIGTILYGFGAVVQAVRDAAPRS